MCCDLGQHSIIAFARVSTSSVDRDAVIGINLNCELG